MTTKKIFTNQADVIAWIQSFNRFGIKPGLDRVLWLLDQLANPQDKLKIIHIGGTNGKGSTSSMLAAALRANGYRVGLFTSPYLEAFNNRIAIDGADIDEASLAQVANQVDAAIQAMPTEELGQVTEFELITVMGLLYFYRQEVDYLILEVGLGGRLDATNVVLPILSIITNIGLDHTDILGDNLAAIAEEKAGIIKPGVSLITGTSDPEALAVIEARCQDLDSDIYIMNQDFSSSLLDTSLSGLDVSVKIDADKLASKMQARKQREKSSQKKVSQKNPHLHTITSEFTDRSWQIGLLGTYQADNLSLVIMTLVLLAEEEGLVLDVNLTVAGLREAIWIGRFELMQESPAVIVDGAHNPQGMAALVQSLADHFGPDRSYVWCIGFLGDKDIKEMLTHILPRAKKIFLSLPLSGRAANPARVRDLIEQVMAEEKLAAKDIEIYFENSIRQAVAMSIVAAADNDIVCIAGSLYLIAEARKYWTTEVVS